MQSIGIDLGTTFIKTSKERIIPSGISENIYLSNNIMEVEGKQYAMGLLNHKSIFDININKTLNRNLRLNYLYALYQESETDEAFYRDTVIGLPCSIWKNDNAVSALKKMLYSPEIIQVSVNHKEKEVFAERIIVVPEGSTAYYAIDYSRFEGRKVLVLDWGGLTINTILFINDEIVDLHTDEFGVLKVYKEMAERITSQTGINVQIEDMLDILQRGLFNDGKSIDIEFIIKPIALDYCNQVYRNLKLRWSINTIPFVLMVGAGSLIMHKYLTEYVPHAELLDNPQLLAAIGMQEMAGVLY